MEIIRVSRENREREMRDVRNFMRANPQAFVLLLICVVLGIGTFLAVLISLATSGGHPTGDPNESSLLTIHATRAALRATASLMLHDGLAPLGAQLFHGV